MKTLSNQEITQISGGNRGESQMYPQTGFQFVTYLGYQLGGNIGYYASMPVALPVAAVEYVWNAVSK
jgi:hypothetical protein